MSKNILFVSGMLHSIIKYSQFVIGLIFKLTKGVILVSTHLS